MTNLTVLICIATGVFAPSAVHAEGKMVVGWLEKARILPGGLTLRAKLDTGAKTCSLTALGMIEFNRNGEQWVRFEVKDKYADKITLERKVLRTASIKQHGAELQKRPVVLVGICLGYVYKEVEVSLVDRSTFNYPMLLGRSFLAGRFIIDPAAKFTTPPSCVEAY